MSMDQAFKVSFRTSSYILTKTCLKRTKYFTDQAVARKLLKRNRGVVK